MIAIEFKPRTIKDVCFLHDTGVVDEVIYCGQYSGDVFTEKEIYKTAVLGWAEFENCEWFDRQSLFKRGELKAKFGNAANVMIITT